MPNRRDSPPAVATPTLRRCDLSAPAHWTSRAHNLPVLYVIFNNRVWNAVKRSVTSHAPQGWAVRTGAMAMSELDPAPDYELIAKASGAWAERVEDPTALSDAIGKQGQSHLSGSHQVQGHSDPPCQNPVFVHASRARPTSTTSVLTTRRTPGTCIARC